ncbi:MAG: hypothetical protein HZA50_17915 [Planctomycetes bacterium]|nr:hypothetical protein [Planctomycetota bacterium]
MKKHSLRGLTGCGGGSIRLPAAVGAVLALLSVGVFWGAAAGQPASGPAASSPASQPSVAQACQIYKAGKGYSLTFKSNHEVSELDAKTEKVRGTIRESIEAHFDVSVEAGSDGRLRLSIQPRRLVLTSGKGANAVSLDTDKPADLEEYEEGQTLKTIKNIRLTVEIAESGGRKVIVGARPHVEQLYPQAKGSEMAESVIAQIDGWLAQCLLQPVVYLPGRQLPDGSTWKFERKVIPSPIGGGEPFEMLESAECKAGSIKDGSGKAAVVEVSGTCKPQEDTRGIEYTIKRSGRVEIDADSGKVRFHRIATSYEGVVPVKESPGKLRGSIVVEAAVEESKPAFERMSRPAPQPATAASRPDAPSTPVESRPAVQPRPESGAAGEKVKFDVKFRDAERFVLASSANYSVRGKDPAGGEMLFEVGCDTRADMPIAVAAGPGGTILTISVKRAVLTGTMKAEGMGRSGTLDTADENTVKDPTNKPFIELLQAVCKARLDKSGAVAEVQDARKLSPILGIADAGQPAVGLPGDTPETPASRPGGAQSGPASAPATQDSQPAGPDPADWLRQVVGRTTVYLPGQPVAVGETWDVERKFLVVTFPTSGIACIVEENVQAKLDSIQDSADGRIAIIKLAGKGRVLSPSGKVVFPDLSVAGEAKFNLDAGRLVSAVTEITGNADMRESPDGSVVSKNTIRIVCQTAVKKDKSASQPAANGEK